MGKSSQPIAPRARGRRYAKLLLSVFGVVVLAVVVLQLTGFSLAVSSGTIDRCVQQAVNAGTSTDEAALANCYEAEGICGAPSTGPSASLDGRTFDEQHRYGLLKGQLPDYLRAKRLLTGFGGCGADARTLRADLYLF